MELGVVGISHRAAPLAIRELAHLDEPGAAAVGARLAAAAGEAAVVSTCARTELYVAGSDVASGIELARRELAVRLDLAESDAQPLLEVRTGRDAAEHLCRVAAGLESPILGEAQILGQVRSALRAAQASGTAGAVLQRLFAHALRAGKCARAAAPGLQSGASVAARAIELAEHAAGPLRQKCLLLIGASRVNELVLARLRARGAKRLLLATSRHETGTRLVGASGGKVMPLGRLESTLAAADVVISATRRRSTVLTAETVERSLAARPHDLLLIDLSVPRALDPDIGCLPRCRLYDIDDVHRAPSAGAHEREVVDAAAIVAEEVERFGSWLRSRAVAPVITSLLEQAEAIRKEELARYRGRTSVASPGDERVIDMLTERVVRRLLHPPLNRLHEAACRGDAAAYVEAMSELFGLHAETVQRT
jgi:glutamyl-tRNA reductase